MQINSNFPAKSAIQNLNKFEFHANFLTYRQFQFQFCSSNQSIEVQSLEVPNSKYDKSFTNRKKSDNSKKKTVLESQYNTRAKKRNCLHLLEKRKTQKFCKDKQTKFEFSRQ